MATTTHTSPLITGDTIRSLNADRHFEGLTPEQADAAEDAYWLARDVYDARD